MFFSTTDECTLPAHGTSWTSAPSARSGSRCDGAACSQQMATRRAGAAVSTSRRCWRSAESWSRPVRSAGPTPIGAHEPAQMPQLTHFASSTCATRPTRPSSRGCMVMASHGQSCGHWSHPVQRRGSTTLSAHSFSRGWRVNHGTASASASVPMAPTHAQPGGSTSAHGSQNA